MEKTMKSYLPRVRVPGARHAAGSHRDISGLPQEVSGRVHMNRPQIPRFLTPSFLNCTVRLT
jgi:hypothetical protein